MRVGRRLDIVTRIWWQRLCEFSALACGLRVLPDLLKLSIWSALRQFGKIGSAMIESRLFFSRLLFFPLFQLGYRYIPFADRQIGVCFCSLSPISKFADFALEGITLACRKVRILLGRLCLTLSFLQPGLERVTLSFA